MPGVWIGENTIPELTEVSAGSFSFAHPYHREFWPGVIVVFVAIVFCSAICLPLVLYLENPIHRIASAAIGIVFVLAISNACWGSTGRIIDTRLRKIRLTYYIFGREFWTWQYDIIVGDYFAIKTGSDEYATGGFHYVYLCRSRPLFLFAAIHLPSVAESAKLVQSCNEIAAKLGIENRGYIGTLGFLKQWIGFIAGKT